MSTIARIVVAFVTGFSFARKKQKHDWLQFSIPMEELRTNYRGEWIGWGTMEVYNDKANYTGNKRTK